MAAIDLIDAYLAELPGCSRRLAHGEWGVTLPADAAGGQPLHVGLRLADGLLTAKAPVLDPQASVDPRMLLGWNRQTCMVRFGCTQSGEVWVHADLWAAAADERGIDRMLGLVCEAAVAARDYVRAQSSEGSTGAWLNARG